MFSANTSQVSGDKLYVEDVFSTYLYTGNGSTGQSITNSVDLAGKGGLVWIKRRNVADDHDLTDTVRGAYKPLRSNSTAAQSTETVGVSAFNSNGFTLAGAGGTTNASGSTYASWTFREAANFFDVVTYTGNGVAGRQIAHNLGVAPGCIIIKQTSGGANWAVYHRSLGNTTTAYLNLTDAAYGGSINWNSTTPTATNFTVGFDTDNNGNGSTYVAYLFAHDTTSDGIIQCGSFTTDGSGSVSVNLGWEPQWVLYKTSATTSNWRMIDNMRGFPVSTTIPFLSANLSNAEATASLLSPTATGFTTSEVGSLPASTAYIYIAIRRGPMRTPTSGTSVFSPQIWTGNGTNRVVTAGGVSPDLFICGQRTSPFSSGKSWWNKLAGQAKYMVSTATGAEQATSDSLNTSSNAFLQDGIALGENINMSNTNYATSATYAGYFFKRAPSFFDEVCYTGTGVSGRTVSHNLGVVPELTIIKARNWSSGEWFVLRPDTATTYARNTLDGTGAQSVFDYNPSTGGYDFAAAPSATQITLGSYANTNSASYNYVAYLFASCPGVSKVGSYTGNGSSQTINCGFAAGARFVMIKRTDSTGDWYVWDTARGIVSGNDPRLSLNTTDAEVTTDDSVDTDSSGFVVNQLSATNINVNAATYLYMAVA